MRAKTQKERAIEKWAKRTETNPSESRWWQNSGLLLKYWVGRLSICQSGSRFWMQVRLFGVLDLCLRPFSRTGPLCIWIDDAGILESAIPRAVIRTKMNRFASSTPLLAWYKTNHPILYKCFTQVFIKYVYTSEVIEFLWGFWFWNKCYCQSP